MTSNTELDALRYQWIKTQFNLSLKTDGSVWTREGVKFTASHRLSANGTQYGAYETLDELVDVAMFSKYLKTNDQPT